MTKSWTLEEAQKNLAEVIKQASYEPQVIEENGVAVAVINPLQQKPGELSTWQALRGNFDFSDMGDEDLFERAKSSDRDIEW